MVRDIALIEPDPQDWAGWVIMFIDKLEEESNRMRFDLNTILDEIVNELQNRMQKNR